MNDEFFVGRWRHATSDPTTPIREWQDMPADVVVYVQRQIKDRVGSAYFDRIHLVGGHIYLGQAAELFRAAPVRYVLVMALKMPEMGIERAEFGLYATAEGELVASRWAPTVPLPLPDLADHPERRLYVSLKQAATLAHEAGLGSELFTNHFHYDETVGVWCWGFNEWPEGSNTKQQFVVNAATRNHRSASD